MLKEDTRIAVYIRLSVADLDLGNKKDESNSVVNQRSLLHGFLDRHTELSAFPRVEFIDDGYSGTRADRPAFQKMMHAIRDGEFNVCISKDYSRMFRDYIEMGDCMECVFPLLNVRYISVNDGYDSDDYKGSTGGIDVVMRNIVYDAYSRDLSLKQRSSIQQRAKKGRRATGHPIYGYMIDPEHRAMDVVDPEAAEVVQRIFRMAAEGMKVFSIAKTLNDEGVMSPGEYYRKKHPEKKLYQTAMKHLWQSPTVKTILESFSYTGAAVAGKSSLSTPCSRKRKTNSKEDWVIVKRMHEAIITEEEYELAQKALHKVPHRKWPEESSYPLKSLVVCGLCERRIPRARRKKGKARYICKYGLFDKKSPCSGVRSQSEEEIEGAVFRAIRAFIETADKRIAVNKKKEKDIQTEKRKADKTAQSIQESIAKLNHLKMCLYDEFCAGNLEKDKFLSEKAALNQQIAEMEKEKKMLEGDITRKLVEKETVSSEAEVLCGTYRNEDHLTYEMAHAFVEKVLIYPDSRIEIVWRFKDIFRDAQDS